MKMFECDFANITFMNHVCLYKMALAPSHFFYSEKVLFKFFLLLFKLPVPEKSASGQL